MARSSVSVVCWCRRLGAVGLVAVVAWCAFAACKPPRHPLGGKGSDLAHAFVRGYFVAPVGQPAGTAITAVPKEGSQRIFLPGVEVILKPVAGGAAVGPVRSDTSGRFAFLPQKAGSYSLCWKAPGFVAGCLPMPIDITTRAIRLDPIEVQPDFVKQKVTVLYGQVRFADGSIPRSIDAEAGVNSYVQVVANAENKLPVGRAIVNDFGDYYMPVPIGNLTVQAQIENESLDHSARKEAMARRPFHQMDFRFPNHVPKLDPLFAARAGVRVNTAPPGDVVVVEPRVRDADGDKLTYQWLLGDKSGSLSSTTDPSVKWTLPASGDSATLRLVVWDRRGGYAQQFIRVSIDGKGIFFGGKVVERDGPAVANAVVEINGKTATTNAAGLFSIFVPEKTRYVMNIRHPDYGLVSKIYADGVGAGTWSLSRATVQAFDPTNDLTIVDTRQRKRCGSLSSGIDWKTFPRRADPERQDKDGNRVPISGRDQKFVRDAVFAAAAVRECPPGIKLFIPKNSMVDDGGNLPPSGAMLNAKLTTIDLRSPDGMPGDYTAVGGGPPKVMESLGAGNIEVTAGGTTYHLKGTAKLTIPVDPSQLVGAAPPATIPLMVYDEKLGAWTQDGPTHNAVLTLVAGAYEATVTHFSTFNADNLKDGQACVRAVSTGLPPQYDLEVISPRVTPGLAPKVVTHTIVNSGAGVHAVYNLPTNVDVVMIPIDTSATPPRPLGIYIVDAGGTQTPTVPNEPAYDYSTTCKGNVVFHVPVDVPNGPGGEFLRGLDFYIASRNIDQLTAGSPSDQALATAIQTASDAYYGQVDPRLHRTTLDDFKAINGFDGIGEENVKYANSGDLGFGRDMHCKHRTASDGIEDYACYVTNFGDINSDDKTDFHDLVNNHLPGATVGMEYSRIESAPAEAVEFPDSVRTMKFYVFNGASNPRVNKANLDNTGARPVPQLCMVCHGGTLPGASANDAATLAAPSFPDRNSVNLGSVFLPFDLHNYTFDDGFNPTFNKLAQQPHFKTINTDIVRPSTSLAIKEIIDQMYAGGAANQIEGFSVPGWNNETGTAAPVKADVQLMYSAVIGNSCRTCHAAQTVVAGPPSRDITWQQANDFIAKKSEIYPFVCSAHVMPNARAAYDLFWNSLNPSQPGVLKVFGDAYMAPFGDACGNASGAPPSGNTYDPGVKQIFQNACGGCHEPGGGTFGSCGHGLPEALDLITGDSGYTNTVGVDSLESAGVKRISTDSNPAHSYLYLKVTNAPGLACGAAMPFGSSGLSAADASVIQQWITAGAPHGP